MAKKLAAKDRADRRKAGKGVAAVVGIGVCRASVASLEQIFASLNRDIAAAYVVAVRQQDGLSVDAVWEAIAGQCKLPVKIAADGETLEANNVYIGGPDDIVTITEGTMAVRRAEQPVGERGTVDSMLISLAEHARERAVAVILSGLGSEGTAGVSATKKFGGLSIAESRDDEAEAAARGAATPAGIVDLLLPVEQIPGQITLYVQGLATLGAGDTGLEVPDSVREQLTQVATVLRNVTGNDFHGYKINTFLRRVQRRMQVSQVATVDDYLRRLKKDREEVHHLFQDLLIGVTQFFRDPHEFDLLERELPKLFEGKGAQDQFRVWVLGCATGEEAYSLGILISEYLETVDDPPHVQIFATDLDARALGVARAGRYASSIAEHVRSDRLARWFGKEGDTYCVVKELREMCIFSPHNMVKDAPFSRIDLLSCRNLLIYLNPDLQDRVIPIFHFSLRPGGILFLGSSESVTRHPKLFAPVDRKHRLFRRIETPTRMLPEFPLSPRAGRREASPDRIAMPARSAALSTNISRRALQVAERFAPAYVVIDSEQEVLHFSGRTGRYLEPATGAASLNLLNLVHRDLRLDLRSALHRALEEKGRVEQPRVPLRREGYSELVNLVVEPFGDGDAPTALIVLFQDAGQIVDGQPATAISGTPDAHVERLESELRLTKDRLQATIEELESTNEELKSSNEEYQSINEELQSANEELETSKEELQSVNEELQTVNSELARRVSELGRANSDLKNLLESTRIATVFLDNDLRVRSFTPAATEVFHLLESDLGRPVDHLGARVTYPDLSDDVRQVLDKLGTVEREVKSREGAHYIARVHPYRSIDNFIAGAVLTFIDVTTAVRAEEALRESEGRLRLLLAELQHRVRNTLGVVKSITRRTAQSSESVDEMAAQLSGRLDAFGRVQAAVTRNPDQGVDLRALIGEELLALGFKDGDGAALSGPDLRVTPRAAESISLAVHELATNAVKHGPAGRGKGMIDVFWQLDGDGDDQRLDLRWNEPSDGVRIEPTRKGFGLELLTRGLPYDLNGTTSLEFAADGVHFNMNVPLGSVLEASAVEA